MITLNALCRSILSGSLRRRTEMLIVITKEDCVAAIVDDDDIDEVSADAAIGFSEQRVALRRAVRALWRGSPELKPERRGP